MSSQHMRGNFMGGQHMRGINMGGQHMGGSFRRSHGRGGPSLKPYISIALRFRDEIKLSDEQVTKLTDLRDKFYRDMIGERATMRTMRFDLRKLLKADKVDIKSAEKQINALSGKRAELRIKRIHAIEQGKAILTGEQYKSLQTLLRERHQARWSGMGQGMQGQGMRQGMQGQGMKQGMPQSGKSKKF
jgi:Spy/CpxP family protein refolding chaperone